MSTEKAVSLTQLEMGRVLKHAALTRYLPLDPQPYRDAYSAPFGATVLWDGVPSVLKPHPDGRARAAVTEPLPCPHGAVGDRFWVRETFAPRLDHHGESDPNPHYVKYRADNGAKSPYDPMDFHAWPAVWRSASVMPRWASRRTLIVTACGAMRLQATTDADAVAAGFLDRPVYLAGGAVRLDSRDQLIASVRSKFRLDPDVDPYVWVVVYRAEAAHPQ